MSYCIFSTQACLDCRQIFSVSLAAFAYCLALSCPGPTIAQNVFEGLNEPGNSFEAKIAYAVSPGGDWIVGRGETPFGLAAFHWSGATGLTLIGDLFGGGFLSVAHGVSDSSKRIVVGSGQSTNGTEAFRYAYPIAMVGLGDLPGGEFYSVAHDVSAAGSVVVGSSDSGDSEAFRWTQATGMVGLGTLPGGTASGARAISDDGTTIVGFSKTDTEWQAFRWTEATGMVGVGEETMQAFGVSSDGGVIVGKGEAPFGATAFRWTQETGIQWLTDEIGHPVANAVSSEGSIVVGRLNNGAFIWDPQQAARDLRDVLIDDFGFDLSQWSLIDAHGISADGLTIVGWGKKNGESQAWRVSVDAAWISGAVGSWDDRSNWAFGIEPNELHNIEINPSANLVVVGPSSPTEIRTLTLGDGSGVAGLVVQPTATISVSQGLWVESNGKLQGTGMVVGKSVVYGILAPSLYASHVGQLDFNGSVGLFDGRVEIDIYGEGTSNFDQLAINGNLFVNDELSVYVDPSFVLLPNMHFLIVDVAGNRWGQFDGLPQGKLVGNFGGTNLFISYKAGDGNDIALFTKP